MYKNANLRTQKMNMLNKNIFAIILLSLMIYSCSPDSSPSGFDENFDHAAQYLKDKDSITLFLNSYYFDDVTERVKKRTGTETTLLNDTRLRSVDVTEDEVDYTMYYLILREGNPDPVKDFPTAVDSVLVLYNIEHIVTNDSINELENRVTPAWITLNATIRGWAYGIPKFKSGRNITSNGPIEYADGGKGVLIIPSGLAYRNRGATSISGVTIQANANIIYYINLYDIVEDTDHDNDSIPSINEDPDGDGDPRNDDTDGDFIPNYLDDDDDNDGTLTRDEDANGDGDPTNDDTDGDGIPDYLDEDNS